MGRFEQLKRECTIKEAVIFAIMFLLPYVGSISVAAGAGNRVANQNWFDSIKKPSWQPPPWLFAPVWAVLYGLIGISSYLVYYNGTNRRTKQQDVEPTSMILEERRPHFKDRKVTATLTFYVVHLVLNWLWQPLFFEFHMILGALVDIVFLWVCVVLVVVLFWRYSRVAAGLLLPYLLWVSFATALNAAIWHLNGDGVVLITTPSLTTSTVPSLTTTPPTLL